MLARNIFTLLSCWLSASSLISHAQSRRLYFEDAQNIWGIDRVDSAEGTDSAYNYDFDGEGVTIYICDTGVDANHADFTGRLEQGVTVYPVRKAGWPGNMDILGHGTHVASTAAGSTYGIAKKATIIPVRVLDDFGWGSPTSVASGIRWAMSDAKAKGLTRKVINLSLESGVNYDTNAEIARATRDGFIVVGAAGNSLENACEVTPGSSSDAVIVGAVEYIKGSNGFSVDRLSHFSNWGPCVDILAPGSRIRGAKNNLESDSYITYNGTSMATPHVTGLVSLIWSKYPSWTNYQVRSRLVELGLRNYINFDPCPSCASSTVNILAQAPMGETLIIDNVDMVFDIYDFGASAAFYPKLGPLTVKKLDLQWNNCILSNTVKMNGVAFIELPSSRCQFSEYSIALQAQEIGADVIVFSTDRCRVKSYDPSTQVLDALTKVEIPVVCISASTYGNNVASKLMSRPGQIMASIGIESTAITTPGPWSYNAIGANLDNSFTEWRVYWSMTALSQGKSDCVQFRADATARRGATLRVALASHEIFRLSTEATEPSSFKNWYIIEATADGSTVLYRNNRVVATSRTKVPNFGDTGANFNIIMNKVSNGLRIALERRDGFLYLQYVDEDPLPNINYFSFGATSNTNIQFSDINTCYNRETTDTPTSMPSESTQNPPPPPPPPPETDAPTPSPIVRAVPCRSIRTNSACIQQPNCAWGRIKRKRMGCVAKAM